MLDLVHNSNKVEINARPMMAETKFYEGYSRWDEKNDRYESWEEAVTRVMTMHRNFYADKMTPELSSEIDFAEKMYKEKYVLGAQRALQFGGDQLLAHHARLYNCVSSYADRPEFFGEFFYLLLCGAGAGFSVQKQHVAKLPAIQERKKQAKSFVVEDSIEGWADALAVLMSSYFVGGGTHPEYEGRKVYFDLSKVRPKGSMISGGFKAPGPEPLRKALDHVEHLIQNVVVAGASSRNPIIRLRPIHVYDISMHASDAVLAGGVRRSATICLFSLEDIEMILAKTGNWFETNPQRARSNNSAVIVRDEVKLEDFLELMSSIRQFGEPGFYFVDDAEFLTNPCVEIGMMPKLEGESGWQGCNLTEINASKCVTEELFRMACRAASILGTLQAGYTDFKYLSAVSKKIFEREALLGVSITGWMSNKFLLENEEIQRAGGQTVLDVNERIANMIGINPCARGTCVKPAGNASVMLGTPSGIHAEHAPRFFRNVQLNKDSEVAQLLAKINPYMVEDSIWSANQSDYIVSFPVIAAKDSYFRDDMTGVAFLDAVKRVQSNWVEVGTRKSHCVDDRLRHNVSNTVTVPDDEWENVARYLFENRFYFAGVSFLSASGDKDYYQSPFTEVLTSDQIVSKYGSAALFASGLIVDNHKGFDHLWAATANAQYPDTQKGELNDLRADWIRRFRKFADNYFGGNLKKTEHCLKDVALLHRWEKIQQHIQEIDFGSELEKKKYVDIDTMGSAACVGNACEIDF